MLPILTNDELEFLKKDWINNPSFRTDSMNRYNISSREMSSLMDVLYESIRFDVTKECKKESYILSDVNHFQRVGITIGDLKLMPEPDKFLKDNY